MTKEPPATTDAEIYEEVRSDLVRFASSLVGPVDAQDVVSTVVTRILARGGLSRLRDPRVYMMRGVRNECRTVHRRRQRDRGRRRRQSTQDAQTSTVDSDLIELVRTLPEQQRTATFLVYWAGFTPSEASRILRVRPSTLRRYLFLARNTIREALNATSNQRTGDRNASA